MENVWVDPAGESFPTRDKKDASPSHAFVIQQILSRKSVSPKHLHEPGPSGAEIELILQAALTAPDHCNLRAWRAVVIPPSRRGKLADVFETAKREECPAATGEDLEKARQKAWNGPALLAILLTPTEDHTQVTVEEQYIALGAALQNMLLAAEALGYGAMITSGRKTRSRALRNAFVRTPKENLVAFVTIGTRASLPKVRTPVSANSYLSCWSSDLENTI